jgi:serine/threonine-protein kinase PRP4
MFSNVVRARDLGEKGEGKYEGEEGGLAGKGVGEGERREVAIKIVRSQESM